MFFAALTPLLPHYVEELGLSKTGAGVLAGAYPAGTFVAAVPSGLITARVGVKAAALAGLAVLIVTTRFIQGISSALTWTAGLTWLTTMAPTEQRGALIGSALAAAIGGALFG